MTLLPLIYQSYLKEIKDRGFDDDKDPSKLPVIQIVSLTKAIMDSRMEQGPKSTVDFLKAFAWCLRDLEDERRRVRNLTALIEKQMDLPDELPDRNPDRGMP